MLVDSSGWIEFIGGGPLAERFSPYFEREEKLIVPAIVLYEVYKKLLAAGCSIAGRFLSAALRAQFVPVDTGISGTTDIEVTKGLKEGDEIITGSYKVLRTIRPGTAVKIDNTAPKKEDEGS